MAQGSSNSQRPGVRGEFASLGSRAAASTRKSLTHAVGEAFGISLDLQRRALDRVLESGELDAFLAALFHSPSVKAAVRRAVDSDEARELIEGFFDGGLFELFVDRLLASPALWRLVDEIVASPSVTAAVSQQGLGFADQVGGEVRARSRKADAWLERTARRIAHREAEAEAQAEAEAEAGGDSGASEPVPPA
jgi:hypothetical protein